MAARPPRKAAGRSMAQQGCSNWAGDWTRVGQFGVRKFWRAGSLKRAGTQLPAATPAAVSQAATQRVRAPPAQTSDSRPRRLLFFRAGWIEGAAIEDFGGLRIARRVELLEEVSGREPFIAGHAAVIHSERGAVEVDHLLRR